MANTEKLQHWWGAWKFIGRAVGFRRGFIPRPGASQRRERGSGNARSEWGRVSRKSRARHKVAEGEWERMRADMYSTIIAAF